MPSVPEWVPLSSTPASISTARSAAVVSVVSEPQVILFVFVGQLEAGELQSSPEGELRWLTVEQLEEPTLATFEDFPFLWERLKAYESGKPPRYLVFDYSDGFTGRETQ